MGMSIDKAIDVMERYEMYAYNAQKEGRNKAIDIMRKYQKIQEIHKKWLWDYTSADAYTKISEVLKDGNGD